MTTRESGFTLLELLIAMTLLVVFLMGLISIFETNRATYVRGDRSTEAHQVVRMAMGEVTRQLRMAGYFPENFTAPPPVPLLRNAVQMATNTALAVHGDIDGAGASQVYLFCWDGDAVRRIVAPQGNVAAYTCAGGDVLADGVETFSFVYFDRDGVQVADPSVGFQLDGQAPAAVPTFDDVTERSAVRGVAINIAVTEEIPHQGPQTYLLSSDVLLRNVR